MRSRMIALVVAIGLLAACTEEPTFRFKELEKCEHDVSADFRFEDLEKIRLERKGHVLRARITAPLTCMFIIANPQVTHEQNRVVLSVDNGPYPPDGDLVACICMRHLQFDMMREVKPGTPIVFIAEDRQFASGYAP